MYLIDAVTKSTKYTISGDVFGARPAVKGMAVDAGPGMNYHIGNDYGTPEGTRLYAPLEAEYLKTVRDGKGDGYGNYILLYLPQMDITLHLAHLNHIEWYEGKGSIAAGTYIGNTGNTGLSFGPHLHLGVSRGKKYDTVKGEFKDGTWINPSDIRIKQPEIPKPTPSKPNSKFQFKVGDVLEISGHYPTVHNGSFISTPKKHVIVKKIFPKDHYPYQVTDEKGNVLGGVDPVNVYRIVKRNVKPTPSKPVSKQLVEGSQVSTTATKDIFGITLDPYTVNTKKTFTVEQVGRNGNNNHILLKEIMTWVDKSTLKVV